MSITFSAKFGKSSTVYTVGSPGGRVIPTPPSAGVGGVGWEAFHDTVDWLWKIWPTIGATYGSYEAIKKILARFRKATDVLVGHVRELEERGFAPADPVRLAAVNRWKVGALSDVLGSQEKRPSTSFRALAFHATP
jgi:hypothetical protein